MIPIIARSLMPLLVMLRVDARVLSRFNEVHFICFEEQLAVVISMRRSTS
jgi:hypothetical protein